MDFYADSGIPYTYTIELPDLGQYGFQLPESNLEEVRTKVVYYWQSMKQNTVKSRAANQSTIQFLTLLAKGHVT